MVVTGYEMPCYHPIDAWQAKGKTPKGKKVITFKMELASDPNDIIKIPCGQCIGCRLERSRQWAIRCLHEASLYEKNCFITLTYSSENLPENSSLLHRDFQLFMKRLRKQYGSGIRFYMCGEYGEEQDAEKSEASTIGRPHFHACIFNHDFSDKEIWKTVNDVKLYVSESLDKLWNKGYATIGDVTFESAAYVARYIVKKIYGDSSKEHYNRIDMETGEMTPILPEYTCMSRRPGIGKDWYEAFKADLYKDFITLRGVKMKPPKYYDDLLEREQPDRSAKIKENRKEEATKNPEENEYIRRSAKKAIKERQIKRLRRNKQK